MDKKIWWLLCLVLTLAACQDSSTETNPAPTSLRFVSPSSNITLIENRLVVTVWQGTAAFTDLASMSIAAHDPKQAGHPITWTGSATFYPDYAIPYWVAYPDFTDTGLWLLDITVQTSDGQTVTYSSGLPMLPL